MTNTITKESFTMMMEDYKKTPNILQIAKKYNVSYSALYSRIKIANRHLVIDESAVRDAFAQGVEVADIARQHGLTERKVRKIVNIRKPATERYNALMASRLEEAVEQYRSGSQQDVTILLSTYKVPRKKLETALMPYGYEPHARVNATKEKVLALFNAGHSRYEIRDALNIAYSTVFNYTKGLTNEKSGRWH